MQVTRRSPGAYGRVGPTHACAPAPFAPPLAPCRPCPSHDTLAAATVTTGGGWHEQQAPQLSLQPRAAAATSPRSPLPPTIPEHPEAAGMSQADVGSASGSSHGSLGELAATPEGELSELLEQRKVVVLG